MKKSYSALLLAALIAMALVSIGLGFLFGLDNPVSWVLILVIVGVWFLYNRSAANKKLVWDDKYSVGVDVLDQDHKRLIDLVNQFQVAYEYNTGDEFERQALNELVSYTKYHFTREERLMQENAYPDFENHRQQHQVMIDKVDEFLGRYEREGHEMLGEVADFLGQWLIGHIQGTDKEYGPFLNEHGVK